MNDMDIYILDASAQNVVAGSAWDNINITKNPFEFVTYTNTSQQSLDYNILLTRYDGASPQLMKYVNFGGGTNFEFDTNSPTLYGHANTAAALATGAAAYYETPEFGVSPPQPEPFTALGGTTILFDKDGNRLATPENRANPNIVAPDGANTTFFGYDIDGDTYPNFFGTSAAAPHAAAVVALLLEGFPYSPVGRIHTALESTAIDMESAGFDFLTGAGLIDAVAAENFLSPAVVVAFDANDDPVPGDQADDGNPDTFLIERNGNDIEVKVNGSLVGQVAAMSWATITINGSTDSDAITVKSLGADFQGAVVINGGSGASNSITLEGTPGDDIFQLWADHGAIRQFDFQVLFAEVDLIEVTQGNNGDDLAIMHDAATNDMFVGYYTGADLYYDGAVVPQVHVCNVANVHALAEAGGYDKSKFYDWTGDDKFVAAPWNGYGEFFYSDGQYTEAYGFDKVEAFATRSGFDEAWFYDTTGDDSFWGKPIDGEAKMTGPGGSYSYRGKYFDRFRGMGSMGGHDTAKLFDSYGDDTFTASAYDGEGHMIGDGFHNWAKYFEEIIGEASAGGHDTAELDGSSGDDTFTANAAGEGHFSGDGFDNWAKYFEEITGDASQGGYDTAELYASANDDLFVSAAGTYACMTDEYSADTYKNIVNNFDEVEGFATAGGNELAKLYDSNGDDTFTADGNEGIIEGETLAGFEFYHRVQDFGLVRAFATRGGNDQALMYDSAGNDLLSLGTEALVWYDRSLRFRAKHFEHVHSYAQNGGNDTAHLYDDSSTVDTLWARDDQAKVENTSVGWSRIAEAFDMVYAHSSDGLNDDEDILGPLSFALNLDDWDG